MMMSRKSQAFTLVEMIMVMVIMGVLSLMAVPRYASFLREQRLNAAELRIRSDIAMVQRRARYLGTSQTMSFSVGSHRYSIVGMPHPDKVGQTYTVRLAEEPYGVSISSVDLGGNADVIFDGQGTPDSAGTIVIRLGSQIRTISFSTSVVPWTKFEPVNIEPEIL
jgi:prepilin-type N-terminal cleavage/methylation domain-containing protein